MTTQLTTTETTTLVSLKNDVFSYLTDLHNNQIKGFYDWDGYWKKKDELELNANQKEYLPQLHEYMNSITINDIVKATNESGREWLKKYGNYGRGRKYSSQLYSLKQSAASINSSFVKNNFEILTRCRLFVGFYLGIYNENEVLELIEMTKKHELESTFYSHRKSQISNAIFRMEILYSFLKDSPYNEICLNELKGLANMQLDYLSKEEGITPDID